MDTTISIKQDHNPPVCEGHDNVLIGQGTNDNGYSNVILIGQDISADYDYQVKVGNTTYNKEREMTRKEWIQLSNSIKELVQIVFGAYPGRT